MIAVVVFIDVVYLCGTVFIWVFSIAHETIFVQIIHFVVVLGIIHFRNEKLNFDVILNEACLVRNKEVGVEYCDIDDELA